MKLPPASRRPFDTRYFRNALGRFATGVTVITTCAPDGGFVGLTVSSFNSVSLEPPLILWSLDSGASVLGAFLQCTHFAVNVLAESQVELSRRFAGDAANRFAGVDFRLGAGGAPLIAGCAAWFDCRNRTHHEAGDHVIFIGEVEACGHDHAPPLIWHGSTYGVKAPHPDA